MELLENIIQERSSHEMSVLINECHRNGAEYIYLNDDYAPINTIKQSLFVGIDGLVYKYNNNKHILIALIGPDAMDSLDSKISSKVYRCWQHLLETDRHFMKRLLMKIESLELN